MGTSGAQLPRACSLLLSCGDQRVAPGSSLLSWAWWPSGSFSGLCFRWSTSLRHRTYAAQSLVQLLNKLPVQNMLLSWPGFYGLTRNAKVVAPVCLLAWQSPLQLCTCRLQMQWRWVLFLCGGDACGTMRCSSGDGTRALCFTRSPPGLSLWTWPWPSWSCLNEGAGPLAPILQFL